MIVTKKANDFKALAVLEDNQIKEVTLYDFVNKSKNGVVLFFYPKDFTFVCPTEIIAFNNKIDNFKELGYDVIGCSTDNEYSHLAWKNQDVNNGGIGQIKYPLVSDIKKDIARQFDILFDDAVSLRASFLIDKNYVVRHAVINDLPLGRNIDDMIRMCESLNFFNKYGEVCPANWHKGKDGMKATPEGVANYLKNNSTKL